MAHARCAGAPAVSSATHASCAAPAFEATLWGGSYDFATRDRGGGTKGLFARTPLRVCSPRGHNKLFTFELGELS